MENKIEIYTDGACSLSLPGSPGGWAFTIEMPMVNHLEKFLYYCEASDGALNTTNQQMELLACIKALEYLKTKDTTGYSINVYSDSAYMINCFKDKWYINWLNNGWKNSKKEPVANKELWIQLIGLVNLYNVEFIKVKGHSGNPKNEVVDKLAIDAKEKIKETYKNDINNNTCL